MGLFAVWCLVCFGYCMCLDGMFFDLGWLGLFSLVLLFILNLGFYCNCLIWFDRGLLFLWFGFVFVIWLGKCCWLFAWLLIAGLDIWFVIVVGCLLLVFWFVFWVLLLLFEFCLFLLCCLNLFCLMVEFGLFVC